MNINEVPSSIPASKEKQAILNEQGIKNAYLGQGLMFVPPEQATAEYNQYLVNNNLKPEDYPLSAVQKKGKGGDFYNSPRLDEVWSAIQSEQFQNGFRNPEAFGVFVREQSREAIEKLFQIDANEIATMQVDNLMQALRCVQEIVPKLMPGKNISRVVLPKKYKYSGHTDFTSKAKEIGVDMEIVEIPEIQIDGTQDLKGLEQAFEQIKNEGRTALFIDQEHNNNASGFDRDQSYNTELVKILKKYEGVIFYFGDDAYKGLKEDIIEPYPLMQELIENEVTAFHYTSFSKTANYRGTPSYKNILTATSGEFADTQNLRGAFDKIQRAEGIGATADGAILMNGLVKDPQFQGEVRVLNQYLKYIRDALFKGLEGTELASLFSEKTNGIFRCMPPEVTKKLNSGDEQVITVGDRINIWPLGNPKTKEFFLRCIKA